MRLLSATFTFLFILDGTILFGQKPNLLQQRPSDRVINTAVPLFTIIPDARAGAMGDAGAATFADANSGYWNIGKLAFIRDKVNFGFSYTPWSKESTRDIDLYNFTGVYKINRKQAIGISARLNKIYLSDSSTYLRNINSNEYAVSASFSRLITNNMGIGVTLKFIHSNFNDSPISGMDDTNARISIAADIGWYWKKDLSKKSNLAFGAIVTDIGNKIRYNGDVPGEYIPTNLRIGSAYTYKINPHNSLTFALDFNKLMAPTPPVYEIDENGRVLYDQQGNPRIAQGKSPDRPLISGILGSFTDAPGGATEEFSEIRINFGMEYWYRNLIAARGGYFWELIDKGDRKYFTCGLGAKYKIFRADIAYLIPQNSDGPLTDKFIFSLQFNLSKASE